eukprot:7390569-Prymnesium_polylepis.3
MSPSPAVHPLLLPYFRSPLNLTGEFVELFRRLCCTGFIILIPQEYVFIRILAAFLVTIFILVLTAVMQPHKKPLDFYLAVICQTLVAICFSCFIIIRVLDSPDISDEAKETLMGFTDTKGAYLALGLMCITFLFLCLSVYLYRIHDSFQRLVRKMPVKNAEASSMWLLTGACGLGISALLSGGTLYGIIGGLVGGAIFFPIGGAIGSVCFFCLGGKDTKNAPEASNVKAITPK